MHSIRVLSLLALATQAALAADTLKPIASADLVFAETGGLVAFEAEHFFRQDLTGKRAWHITHASGSATPALPDSDDRHVVGSSGNAYIEALPDTRATQDDKLVHGENFTDKPDQLAVLSYKVNFSTPGRYHVWARIFSTGSEDNSVHFGIDGAWPVSGRRWQTVKKNAWAWDSRQRTQEVQVGVPGQLFLDVATAGEHVIQVSMREDGFELDRILLTTDSTYTPEGLGPETQVHRGTPPMPFPVPENYDEAWLHAGTAATAPAPASAAASPAQPAPLPEGTIEAASLPLEGTGFYLDRGKWAAIDPAKNKEASVKFPSPAANGRYRIILHVVGESDGNSTYEVHLGGRLLGTFTAPATKEPFEEGSVFTKPWSNVLTSQGEMVEVRARIASHDGKEWSRGRWSKLVFTVQEADPGKEAARLDLAAEQRAALFKPVPRQPDGDGSIRISGELKQWHAVALELSGPFAAETDTTQNPFTDSRFDVTFRHESGAPVYVVPGYFAADGRAAETSATAGTVWRARLSPDKPGRWDYSVSFTRGPQVAMNGGGTPLAPFHGRSGSFTVAATDKTGADFRAAGRLTYTGGHYLRRAGTGELFLKAGADAPETLLAFTDFDDTIALKPKVPLKTWAPHVGDWRAGDPTWKGGKGKGLIGALNYLAAAGGNAISFLTYNAGGDGDNVWPFVARDEKFHYDCSRLDQWDIVFAHAQRLGIFLHFKLQENENDDDFIGAGRKPGTVPESFDGGETGPERRLYLREMIARFGHHLGLNWNIGEENTQTPAQQNAMAAFIQATDPYHHLLVIHAFPEQQNSVYEALLGNQSILTGASTQNPWDVSHKQTLKWVRASAAAGRPWVVCNDEQGHASLGVPPDLGYRGFEGKTLAGKAIGYDENDIRKATLWGTLMAGGGGVEYYFGYQIPENDLLCEDFRSRDRSWRFGGIALEFFARERLPLDTMANADELVGNADRDNSRYCLARKGDLYLVYLPNGGACPLDLTGAPGDFTLAWFNPREGGALKPAGTVRGGGAVTLTAPDSSDWLAVLRR